MIPEASHRSTAIELSLPVYDRSVRRPLPMTTRSVIGRLKRPRAVEALIHRRIATEAV